MLRSIYALIRLLILGAIILPDSFGMLGSFMRAWEVEITTTVSTVDSATLDVELSLNKKRYAEWKSLVSIPGRFVDQRICNMPTTPNSWCEEAGVSK
jgi:hypothetical protein